ncbi:hypothetical protein Ddye_024255 [Dipteronia dyeriana]|uniref:MULE transposase domain-containing protein n=1 Tax=Dipteronia dyeriana TaxID=168575 RepID=A0AAD9TUZ4_9ROSI|nr:hypothetical protein Ddye_024255 [Dipteronia dyeriana]
MWEKHNGQVNVIFTSDDENGVSPPEFEINTDHGMDSFDEQYPFIKDETFGDFIGEEGNGAGVNCDSQNFDDEGDIGGESAASDHSHSSGDHDNDIVGNPTTQRGPSIVTHLVEHSWALLAKDHAESIVFRPTAESFQRIPSSLYMLERKNPDTVTDFELDDEGRFKFSFFSYSACIHGFSSVIRPVITIDDTHQKRRFCGILFMAACSDGNEKVYPLAFRISHKESKESWTWFLRRVRKYIDCPTDCMFIFD